jgi:Putative MetA-pathway of phenol degradation
MTSRSACVLGVLVALLAPSPGLSQALEPRAYSISPVGTNILVLGYGLTSGEIVFDPSLPVQDSTGNIHGITIGYARALSLFGRSTNFRIAIPYALANLQGRVSGEFRQIYRSGLGDPLAQLSINLYGAPALRLDEFARYRQHTNISASVAVSAPFGQYDPARLINIGTNRVAVKPEIAISHATGNWYLDGYAGVWLYTENSKFFPGGSVQKQKPLGTYQGHVSYTIRPRLWTAFDVTYYGGGNTELNGKPTTNRLSSSRIGVTLSVPLARQHSIKVLYARTALARLGGRFNVLQIGYAFVWFDK